MDTQHISKLQEALHDLLSRLKTSCGPLDNGYTDTCTLFLKKQKEQLLILKERMSIHMMERGKVKFRLIAKERVTVSDLKDLYDVFARQLDEFIQLLSPFENSAIIRRLKENAVALVLEMLEISLVLETQPDSINYDKNQNELPTLLCLGAQCFSESAFRILDCQVTVVSDSDLSKASFDGKSLKAVEGLKGVTVKAAPDKKSAKSSSLRSRSKAVATNLGTWSIPKDKLSTSDKGSAHKDWLRLKFTMQVKYRGVAKDLWLLSLPFNIRKGSVQMYTFIGALMWYFYVTPNPYQDFKVVRRLSTETFLDMLIARLEVIGRKISPEAKTFLRGLLLELSSDRTSEPMIDLDTVTRGPPSKKATDPELSPETPTVRQTIETYGFFTWFYALVYSLDESCYLNKLWLDGYIYDICGPDYARKIVENPMFGRQIVIIRPSMSHIYNHQGKQIHMGFSLFYKSSKSSAKVLTLHLQLEDLVKCGLYLCLKGGLALEHIYMKDGKFKNIDDFKNASDEHIFYYHGTKYTKNGRTELAGDDAVKKHCPSCRCHHAEMNSLPDGETKAKKVRSPSGNSDHISSSSDWQEEVEGLLPMLKRPHDDCSDMGNLMNSPLGSGDNMRGSFDSDADTGISSVGSTVPHFNQFMSPESSPMSDTTMPTTEFLQSATARETVLANFHNAFQAATPFLSNEDIEKLTNFFLNQANGQAKPMLTSFPDMSINDFGEEKINNSLTDLDLLQMDISSFVDNNRNLTITPGQNGFLNQPGFPDINNTPDDLQNFFNHPLVSTTSNPHYTTY